MFQILYRIIVDSRLRYLQDLITINHVTGFP